MDFIELALALILQLCTVQYIATWDHLLHHTSPARTDAGCGMSAWTWTWRMHTYIWNTRLVVETLKFSIPFLFCVLFYWLLLLLRSDQDCIRAQGRARPILYIYSVFMS